MAPRPTPPCHHGRHHHHHTPISCPGSKAPRKHTAASLTPTQHHPCSPEAPQNLGEHNLRHLPPPSRARQLHPLAPLHLRRTLGHPSSRGPGHSKRKPLPSLTANIFFFALQPPQPRRQTKTPDDPCSRATRVAPQPRTQRPSPSSTETLPFLLFLLPSASLASCLTCPFPSTHELRQLQPPTQPLLRGLHPQPPPRKPTTTTPPGPRSRRGLPTLCQVTSLHNPSQHEKERPDKMKTKAKGKRTTGQHGRKTHLGRKGNFSCSLFTGKPSHTSPPQLPPRALPQRALSHPPLNHYRQPAPNAAPAKHRHRPPHARPPHQRTSPTPPQATSQN